MKTGSWLSKRKSAGELWRSDINIVLDIRGRARKVDKKRGVLTNGQKKWSKGNGKDRIEKKRHRH